MTRDSSIAARRDHALNSIQLSDVIGKAIRLHKAGAEYTGLCPFHADKRIGTFMVNDRKAIYKCFACGQSGTAIDFLMNTQKIEFLEALKLLENFAGISQLDFNNTELRAEIAKQREAREAEAAKDNELRRHRAAKLWHGSEPIARDGKITPAAAYLIGRGIDFRPLGKIPGALRWRPDIGHPDFKGRKDNRHAAMIAAIFNLDGQIMGCHRTYLDISGWDHARSDGRVTKLGGVSDAKLSLGPTLGGHIPIWKGEHRHPLRDIPAGTDIYVSEGIEDGASVAVSSPKKRVICGVSLSKYAALQLPPQMGRLIFIGQRDEYGSAAADAFERAIKAHQEEGRTVEIMWPPEGYKDFNDVLTGTKIGGK